MAALVMMYPEGPQVGKEFPLPAYEVIVGRDDKCAVHIDSDSVSRHHARIYFTGDAWIVEDLKSANGSFINDVPVTRSVLRDCDALRVGGVIFKFRIAGGFEIPQDDSGDGDSGSGAPAILGVPKPRRDN